MIRPNPAPGDEYAVSGTAWEVISCWQEVGADYRAVDWVKVYRPDRGTFMVRQRDGKMFQLIPVSGAAPGR